MGLLGSMGLLFPGALYFLAIVPVLVAAYLVRERPRPAIVSSLLAFRALRVSQGRRFGGKPHFTWTFFLELLLLCLAVLAMARPYMIQSGSPIAVVLDNSAAMQAITPAGKSRFETAIGQLKEALNQERSDTQVTVYVTAPRPQETGTFDSVGSAITAISGTSVFDTPDNPAALTSLLTQLNADRHLGRVIYAGYRPIASPTPSRLVPFIASGELSNYAIGSFSLSRETLGSNLLRARVTVANFSPSAETLTVTISGDGKPVGRGQARVNPGEVATIEIPNLPPAQVYRAQLEPHDGFMLDNVAYATASSVKSVAILFVSPTPADGSSLGQIPGISVATVTPNAYTPQQLANSDLAIFEYTAPKDLPTVNSLLVLPPPNDPVFRFNVQPASQVELTAWPTTDPLTEGVNFRLLNTRSGEYFGEHPWMRPIISGAQGGVMLAGQRGGRLFVATGFNPFPYLGRRNLPMSILTLNMLSYLAGLKSQAGGFHTGDSWHVPAGIAQIVLPSGSREAVRPGDVFNAATAQGVYQLIGADRQKTYRAVNLADLTTSDLENIPAISLGPSTTTTAQPANVQMQLTPYILAVIIALIMLEAFMVYRRRRPLVGLQP